MLYRFADFELDEARRELRRRDTVLDLQPKVMEVLLHLARNADRVCSKDELIDSVWADTNVSEASLVRCVAIARRALGEREADARIILTVRGHGYRMGVPVRTAAAEAPRQAFEPAPVSVRGSRRRWVVLACATALLAMATWLARPYAELPALESDDASSSLPITSVAVIPAHAIHQSDEARRLAEELALRLIDRLGAVAELRVASHASALEASRAEVGAPSELGQKLEVGSLVFERVEIRDDTLRVVVEVVDANTGFQRWSRRYVSTTDAAGELSQRITEEATRVIGTIAGVGPDFVRQHGEVSATDYYLQGRDAVYSANRERLLEAVGRYEQAIELDPSYVGAYVGLADAYERLWHLDRPGAGWVDRGEIAALRALELDPTHSDALAAHATLLRARREWDTAEVAYRAALEHGPSAYTYSRFAAMLCMVGRTAEAVPLVERSIERAPHDAEIQRTAGRVHHYFGNHDRAVAHLRRAMELAPRDTETPRILADALRATGQWNAARETLLMLAPPLVRPWSRIHARLFGWRAGMRRMLELDIARIGKTCRGDGMGTAMAWALLDDRERMLECLAEDVDRHLWYVVEEPVFDAFRDDARFKTLLARAGFPTETSERRTSRLILD